MTDLLNAYWAASAAHRDASHACRAARRAAMDTLRRAYEALHGLTD